MLAYARTRVRKLMRDGLDGYILKKGSPSCGPGKLRVYRDDVVFRNNGVGFYANEIIRLHPHLPVQDEARLSDIDVRKNFVERVFCRHRWRTLVARGLTRPRLAQFHAAHAMLPCAHDEAGCRRLGRIVNGAGRIPDRDRFATYEDELHRVMRANATHKRHARVLQHAMGYVMPYLSASGKRHLSSVIEKYARDTVPLVVPLQLLRFAAQKYGIDTLRGQLYFDPCPAELIGDTHSGQEALAIHVDLR